MRPYSHWPRVNRSVFRSHPMTAVCRVGPRRMTTAADASRAIRTWRRGCMRRASLACGVETAGRSAFNHHDMRLDAPLDRTGSELPVDGFCGNVGGFVETLAARFDLAAQRRSLAER